jgi:hypothetical protein
MRKSMKGMVLAVPFGGQFAKHRRTLLSLVSFNIRNNRGSAVVDAGM